MFSARAISPIAAVRAFVSADRSSEPLTPSMLPPPSMMSGSPEPFALECLAFHANRIDCLACSLIGVGNLNASRRVVPVAAMVAAHWSRLAISSSCVRHLSSGLSPMNAHRL